MSTRPIVDPLIGKTVAQHTILAKLGGGGMGVVYQARDAKLGRLVALKFLPPQWSHDDSAKQRFIREAQAASATEHPNICTIHDIETTDDGQLFIVMSYYEGQTLKQRLEAGPLSVDEALQVATQVAEGLVKAHARGIVHRDIKPGNLMLTEDGVRILDFGLAKFADALHLTMVGSTLGTAAYMSPEQARSEEADARSDLWGVGVVLYEMLTGETPFKGIYPEAISYAIRNDPTPPLKAEERGIPERVEQLVLKTLQKDPAERYQTARELARDLRLLQGLTVPFDLRTEPVSVPRADQVSIPKRFHWRRPVLIGVALLVLTGAGMSAWLLSPVPRIPIAVAPVINLTGDRELDGYRLALTETLVAELTESATVRVVPYGRLLEILRRFVAGESDVSSRDALQAIASHSAATFIVVPTLVYENNAWRARAEFRSALTATNVAVHDTEPIVSSLNKETAFKLMASLAEDTQKYFDDNAPRNRRALDAIRRLSGFRRSPITPRMRSLDASAAFERGLNAYEQLEFVAAREAFARAAEQDPRNSIAFAWWSRAAQIVRQDSVAQQAADQATKVVSAQTSEADRMFVAAVSAEAQRDFISARARYRDLASKYSDEPAWLIELAGFEDRHGKVADAIATYRQALALDGRLVRPHLELCKLYNRITEFASAEEQGTASLSGYRALGNRGGEAQALLCRADRLRLGSDDNRNEARVDAESALKIFTDLGSSYNIARGYNYVALAAEVQGQGHPSEAAALWEQSLARARDAGNVVLQPLVLMNLGVMYVRLGSHSRALDYYQQSHDLNEALGNELGAAQNQANVGAILIENAGRREEGLRGVQNALEVFRKVGDTKFEAFSLKVLAAANRYVGQHAEAERELNRALALIGERNVDRDVAALTIDLARSRLELSDYVTAENLLLRAVGIGSGKDSAEARIHLALAHLGLGKFADAQTQLTQASAEVQARGDSGRLPSLHEAMGELALESGLLREARQHFRESAALWTDDLPDPASVQARAYLGLLDALDGQPVRAQSAIQSSLDQARKIGLLSLEARCRVFLAQALISERRFGDALSTLNAVLPDSEKSLGPELQAYLHYWRSRALAGQGGDLTRSDSERNVAKKLLEDLRASLPEPYRSSFTLRPAIRQLIG